MQCCCGVVDAEKFGEWWDREASRAWLREFLGKMRSEKEL